MFFSVVADYETEFSFLSDPIADIARTVEKSDA
jgi:hypothetical protein